METGVGGIGARTAPSPNAGKIVKVRWVKRYRDAATQVCIGEVVRETPLYLVTRGALLSFHKGEDALASEEEKVRWIPWQQIAAVTELPQGLKWRECSFYLDESGRVLYR